MIADPSDAPPRTDLGFLRRRSRPRPAAPPPARETPAPAIDFSRPDRDHPRHDQPHRPSGNAPTSHGGVDYTHRDDPRHDHPRQDQPHREPAAPPAGSSVLDLSAPSTPAAPPASGRPAARAPSASLDLSAPAAPPARPAAVPTASLDLSGPSAPAASPPPPAAARPAPHLRSVKRVVGREHLVLDIRTPTVTLTRLQSGIGHLTVEAVCSAEVGDLRLGAAYQLRSGVTSTVQLAGGERTAPPRSRRPVLLATHEEFERISVDLRQVNELERVALYAFSESRSELHWGGTLRLTTFGGGRVELPLETLYAGRAAVLMSIYNVEGELVVRAEMETIAGDVREAARAYGYDRITWRDDRFPVD